MRINNTKATLVLNLKEIDFKYIFPSNVALYYATGDEIKWQRESSEEIRYLMKPILKSGNSQYIKEMPSLAVNGLIKITFKWMELWHRYAKDLVDASN